MTISGKQRNLDGLHSWLSRSIVSLKVAGYIRLINFLPFEKEENLLERGGLFEKGDRVLNRGFTDVYATPKSMVFEPFCSENGYRICSFWAVIGYGFRGNYGNVCRLSCFVSSSRSEKGRGFYRLGLIKGVENDIFLV